MENAAKALLIAGGVLIIILILSVLVVFYDEISTYYAQQHESVIIEQTQKFNAKFENYHRNNIRGNELISLMNSVIDYNTTESYFDGTEYERIKVTITLVENGQNKNEILKQFKYPTNDNASINKYLDTATISNISATGDNWSNDKNLIDITNTSFYLCEKAKENPLNINNLSDKKLQLLASNAGNIIIDENDNSSTSVLSRFKRADILEEVLGIKVSHDSDSDIKIDVETGKTNVSHKNIMEGIKDITSQYFQYMQFKRAYFDCTEMKYDEKTDRVVEINFKLQTENGKVVFERK